MQDLSSYQSEPANAGSGTAQPATAKHQSRTMMRSKSDSYNKGEAGVISA